MTTPHPAARANTSAPAIEAEKLVKKFGDFTAVDGISFTVPTGSVLGLLGPNGSGKTTLLRSIIGAVPPQAGRIVQAPSLRIGYVPQKLHIDPTLPLTVRRVLSLPRKVAEPEMRDALEQAGAGDLADQQMARLSGGQFQRVLLARAL